MVRKMVAMGAVLLAAASVGQAADTGAASSRLSATEIVNRNVAARGGLQAWRAVQSLTWQGKMGAGGNQRAALPDVTPGKKSLKLPVDPRPKEEVQLPFTMEMQRPHKTRVELQFKGQTAVQVYDGTKGWKLRPFLNRMDVEPFTEDEAKVASLQQELDGPLVDYVAKGTRVELDGLEKVENREAYKLKLTLKSGQVMHLWIDAQTFLDAKIEGQPRRLDGKDHPVEVYYRDFRQVNGLQIPFVLETQVLPVANLNSKVRPLPIPPEKIVIEKVVVNPKLDASLFTKPQVQMASNVK